MFGIVHKDNVLVYNEIKSWTPQNKMAVTHQNKMAVTHQNKMAVTHQNKMAVTDVEDGRRLLLLPEIQLLLEK